MDLGAEAHPINLIRGQWALWNCCSNWLGFSTGSRHEEDNRRARDHCNNDDDYFLDRGTGRRSGSFNAHWAGRPMPLDADGCADVDPVVEPLGGIGARQRQGDTTARGGVPPGPLESLNEKDFGPPSTPPHPGVV